jgi:hypothetical protein
VDTSQCAVTGSPKYDNCISLCLIAHDVDPAMWSFSVAFLSLNECTGAQQKSSDGEYFPNGGGGFHKKQLATPSRVNILKTVYIPFSGISLLYGWYGWFNYFAAACPLAW